MVQYTAQLVIPASQFAMSSQNLSVLAQGVIDDVSADSLAALCMFCDQHINTHKSLQINQFSSGQEVLGNVNTTFYFIELNGNPV